jgi:hypothetical protein
MASLLVGWLGFEAGIRFFIQPSDDSYGILFGRKLPPFAIFPEETPRDSDRSATNTGVMSDGIELSKGDLWGFNTEDPVLGYEPEKNARSVNGWWQSNNIGARKTTDTSPEVPEGKARLLIFGDSFAHGSRLKQEDAWPSVLDSYDPQIDVVSLAVDGYSMAQAYLRYRKIKSELDYDIAALMFVPDADLWRDINTMRYIGGGWRDYQIIMPRFVLREGSLEAVPSPYRDRPEWHADNVPQVSETLRRHLRKFDRFYVQEKHESPFLIGHSVVYKLFARRYFTKRWTQIRSNLYSPNSEALRVTRSIFRAMNGEVRQAGKRFFLVILPTVSDLKKMAKYPRFAKKWQRMISFLCDQTFACLDLTVEFRKLPLPDIDLVYDGHHYGPKTNRRIADAIARYLKANQCSNGLIACEQPETVTGGG